MSRFSFDYQHIVDAQGIELAFAGMIIVFTVLSLVCIFLALLPHILTVVNRYIPEVHHHAAPQPKAKNASNEADIAAAVAFVLHGRAQGRA